MVTDRSARAISKWGRTTRRRSYRTTLWLVQSNYRGIYAFGMVPFAKLLAAFTMVVTTLAGSGNVAWSQEDVGKAEYNWSCASCHGIDGKGGGPVSGQLKVAPPDLTVLTKNNKGVFPVASVYAIIDGRQAIAAHGTREMSVWGAYIMAPLYPSDRIVDRSYNPEAFVRTRILSIIDYLNRSQEK